MRVYVTGVHADEGTVVVFDGIAAAGKWVRFGCDHRSAQPIIDALDECNLDEDIVCQVESWQLLGSEPAPLDQFVWSAEAQDRLES